MQPYKAKEFLADIWSYVRPYKNKFLLGTFLRLIGDIAWLYPAYGFASIVNFFSHYEIGQPITPVYWYLSFMALAATIRYWARYHAKTIIYRAGEKITLDAEHRAMRHLLKVDIDWHERQSAGGRFKIIERGADGVQRILRIWVDNFIEIATNFVGMIFIISTFDRKIAFATFCFLFIFFILSRFFRKRAVASQTIVNLKEESISGLMFETINNIRTVKVMSMGEQRQKSLWNALMDMFESIKIRIFWFQMGSATRTHFGQMFSYCMMGIIIYGITQGHYEVGFLVLFDGYFSKILTAISELSDVSQTFQVAKTSLHRLQDLLSVPVTIDEEQDKAEFPKDWQTLELKDVSFSYEDKEALSKVSFTVKRGERLGIVGLSGSGKSTLFKLLLKENESYDGSITFDGNELRDVSKRDYLKHVAVVLQETELFNTSLEDNIAISEKGSSENLKKAIDIAHVTDFMQKLPQGVKTIVGEKGVKLSGGEKQRVGLARAIYKDPQILFLDEATSHLDIESEKKIQESLHTFFGEVTAVVIAHRLTTIKEMDRILVLENGKIIEEGSFSKLQKMKGRFHELWEQQKL